MSTQSTLSVPQAADRMNIHPETMLKMLQRGTIPAAKIGRSYVILEKDVMKYIEDQVIKQTAQRQHLAHMAFGED
jgi:excisionase family DNA binding protein